MTNLSIEEVLSIVIPIAKKMAERTDIGIADISYNGSKHSFIFTLENGDTVHIPFHIEPNNISYSNNKLESTNIKSAIDELVELLPAKVSELVNDSKYIKERDLISSISDTSTNTQVANAKAIYDFVKANAEIFSSYTLDVGSVQAEINSVVYPKISVANAKKIRKRFREGKNIVAVWNSDAVKIEFSPIYSSNLVEQFMAIIHGNIVKYEWQSTAGDDELVSPSLVKLEKFIHFVKVEHQTGSGLWKYQFQFIDSDMSQYTMLYNVASRLYTDYRNVKMQATGTYTEGNTAYVVLSITAISANQVRVEMVKLSDGTIRTIETGAVPVVDTVSQLL